MNWKPSALTFGLLVLICLFAPVAFGADPPVPDITIGGIATSSGVMPWLGALISVLSTLMVVIREGRAFVLAILDKVHAIAKDCQPTIRVVHATESADETARIERERAAAEGDRA